MCVVVCTVGYAHSILEQVVQNYTDPAMTRQLRAEYQLYRQQAPEPLAAGFEHPDKMEAIEAHQTRFA